MKKRVLSLMMAGAMILGAMTGCSGNAEETTAAATAAATEAKTEVQKESNAKEDAAAESVNIGVIQYMQHESLDEAYNGFVDGLAEAG